MAKKATAAKEETRVSEVILELPIGSPADGYEGRQAESGKISLAANRGRMNIQAQLGADVAFTFMRIRNGLRDRGAKLGSGRPVWTNVDVIRWMMEQVSAQLPAAEVLENV